MSEGDQAGGVWRVRCEAAFPFLLLPVQLAQRLSTQRRVDVPEGESKRSIGWNRRVDVKANGNHDVDSESTQKCR